MNYVDVKEGLPLDSNDCRVLFEDGSQGIAYFSTAGHRRREDGVWCTGFGMPIEKKVVKWFNTGNCDSVKPVNQYKE